MTRPSFKKKHGSNMECVKLFDSNSFFASKALMVLLWDLEAFMTPWKCDKRGFSSQGRGATGWVRAGLEEEGIFVRHAERWGNQV